MGEGNGTNKGAPSLPGGNEYTSHQEELQSWDSHPEECGAEPPGDTYTEAYRAKVYGLQAFLVNVVPAPNYPLAWYHWEAKDLKESRKAVAEDGPNSPWAMTLLREVAYHTVSLRTGMIWLRLPWGDHNMLNGWPSIRRHGALGQSSIEWLTPQFPSLIQC